MSDDRTEPNDAGAIPPNDGACDHLMGLPIPDLRFSSIDGDEVSMARLSPGPAVIYIYPMTGSSGADMPDGWELVSGASGCTPQSCSYRDDHAAFRDLGASVFGLSGQSTEAQREFADREHIPFPLLSDPELKFGAALGLPTFEVAGEVFYKRVTLIIETGQVAYVRYPVFPPSGDALVTLEWLRSRRA